MPLSAAWSGASVGEPNAPLGGAITLSNSLDAPATVRLDFSLQCDPALTEVPAIDPVFGRDRALGQPSWTDENGKRLEEGSLTDGRDWTGAFAPWGQHTETVQTLDLGQTRRITKVVLGPYDANWAWKVDVLTSLDGKTFAPVPSLQGINLHERWGAQTLLPAAPFPARFVRLRHHNDGKTVNQIAMPSSLSVYDGVDDEKWELPRIGEVVAHGSISSSVPARSSATVPIQSQERLAPGAYLLAFRARSGAFTSLSTQRFFVMPPAMARASSASRFGLNTALVELAPLHRRLGVGWVRFENFKWPMISPQPHLYKFDGTVGPWNVAHDAILEGYAKQGISTLPFLFQTPDYATSAPGTVKQDRWGSYPPKDNALFGEFAFQSAARYGTKTHPASELLSPDKKSALGRVNVYELWNEPNLTDPGWGPWVGTNEQYLDLFRAGAQGVKRADPSAQVMNGGLAGIGLELVEPFRTYRYADGKRPLDFLDVLGVHYYSGRVAPEIATIDGNADRSGTASPQGTLEEGLRRLIEWRDANKPKMPIWMTETGYDSAGPFGTDERTQAARLPRVVMTILGAGVDKVFVYRESGSTPSMHAASGVLRDDGTAKPSWFSYATLVRQLDGVQSGARLPYTDPNVRLYAWKRGGETILSAWTIEGSGELKLPLGACRVVDAFGGVRQENVAQSLALSPYPIYISAIANAAPIKALEAQRERNEAARRGEQARLARLKAYLFDFGSTDHVGTLQLGTLRRFTPVLAKDVYDEARGYGLVPRAALQDEVQGWVSDPLERDNVRVNADVAFQMRVEPGRYLLRVSAAPLGKSATLTIKNARGADQSFEITGEKSLVEAPIEAGAKPLVLAINDYASLKWLSLVKQ